MAGHACQTYFNPPTPCGVGPIHPTLCGVVVNISIHPPRAGWDLVSLIRQAVGGDFNPPTPCGVGPAVKHGDAGTDRFQSTHPVRGGTTAAASCIRHRSISIHPPRVGWDLRRERRRTAVLISIHPPRVGWDDHHRQPAARAGISIHPPRVGWDSTATSRAV